MKDYLEAQFRSKVVVLMEHNALPMAVGYPIEVLSQLRHAALRFANMQHL